MDPAEARRAAELAELKEIEAEEERRREDEARKHSEANARRAEAARVSDRRHRHRPDRPAPMPRDAAGVRAKRCLHGAPPRRAGTGPADASPAR